MCNTKIFNIPRPSYLFLSHHLVWGQEESSPNGVREREGGWGSDGEKCELLNGGWWKRNIFSGVDASQNSAGMIPSTLAHYICDSFNGSSAFDLY